MNLGIGYEFLSAFLQSQSYYRISIIAYLFLLIAPFIFWKYSKRGVIFIVCMSLAFTVAGLIILYMKSNNPDEATHLVLAYSLINGGVPFKDFEGNSAGPFNAFYLALFSFGQISFFTARVAVIVTAIASGIMIFFAGRKLCGVHAGMTLSCVIFFYYSIHYFDAIYYNSETPFCFLMSLWFLLFAFRRGSRRILFAECFVAGLMPWVKLQFVPFSVMCFILSLSRNLLVNGYPNDKKGLPVAAQECKSKGEKTGSSSTTRNILSNGFIIACFAEALPTLMMLAYLTLSGAIGRFWLFYVTGNLHAATKPNYIKEAIPFLLDFAHQKSMFEMSICASVAFLILALGNIKSFSTEKKLSWNLVTPFRPFLFFVRLTKTWRQKIKIGLLALFVVVALFTITRSMTAFDHYVNILVPASAIFVGLGLTMVTRIETRTRWSFAIMTVLAVVFASKLMMLNNIQAQQNKFISDSNYVFNNALKYLNERVKTGEPVVFWGWEPEFSVYSQHPSATSTHLLSEIIQLDQKIRDEYIYDIISKKPAAIVDLVCPAAFAYKEKQDELTNYDFIRQVAEEYYEKPVSVPAGNDGFVRIYLRKKDR